MSESAPLIQKRDIVSAIITMLGLFLTLFIRDQLAPHERNLAAAKITMESGFSVLNERYVDIQKSVDYLREHVVMQKEFDIVVGDIHRRLDKLEIRRRADARTEFEYVATP